MKFEEPTFKPKAGYFRVGTVSPKRIRGATKPSVQKRKVNYKKGLNARENRKRRSSAGKEVGKKKKTMVINNLRSGGKNNSVAEGKPSTTSFPNISAEAKLGDGKKYTGSAKDKLVAFYEEHNPSKLGVIDKTLKKYAGKEDLLFASLAEKYKVNPGVFGLGVSSEQGGDGAFKEYAGANKNESFGFLAGYRNNAPSNGFGSQQADNKGRSTITSLKALGKALGDEFRAPDADMDCD
jgi:hypothetical protein